MSHLSALGSLLGRCVEGLPTFGEASDGKLEAADDDDEEPEKLSEAVWRREALEEGNISMPMERERDGTLTVGERKVNVRNGALAVGEGALNMSWYT